MLCHPGRFPDLSVHREASWVFNFLCHPAPTLLWCSVTFLVVFGREPTMLHAYVGWHPKNGTQQAGAFCSLTGSLPASGGQAEPHARPYLEMSPQYHSASCRDMLFMPLLATVVGLGGFGGSAAGKGEKKVVCHPDSKCTFQIRIASFQKNNISLQQRKVRRKWFHFILIKDAQKFYFQLKGSWIS